jgi:signal transduction histidine kinase
LASVDELWLAVLQRLCDATAHDLKGALNGVSLNVEVLRSRTGRPGVDAASLHQFADSAALELESVIGASEAMLSLARSLRGAADVSKVVRDVVAILDRPAAAHGGRFVVDKSVESVGLTSAAPAVVRLVVGSLLWAVRDGFGEVVCSGAAGGAGPVLGVTWSERDGSRLALDQEMVLAARDAAVHLDTTETGATITFPT